MKSLEIAHIFNEIADMLELKDENPFRIRAYRKAALSLESLGEDLEKIAARNELEKIPGIGRDLALKIKDFLAKGDISFYDKVKAETPSVMLEMLAIPGIGPKTAKSLYEKLKIKDISELEQKARTHKIRDIPGFKDKTEENIIKGIEFVKRQSGKMLLSAALVTAERVVEELENVPGIKAITPAGSLRRRKETIRDIDILVASKKPSSAMNAFRSLPQVKRVLAYGPTRSSVLTKDDIQVDIRVVGGSSFGSALVYFTGSKAHNIRLRKIGIKKGLKVNEYGVFKGKKKIAGRTEKDVYAALGLDLIPPELREDLGEIEASGSDKLPDLVELKDIKGDLHIHSEWSDGICTIDEMAEAARKKGYKYIAITDHSRSLKIAGGLSNKERLEQIDLIRKTDKKKGIKILAGAEVDILDDGSIDYPDDILRRLDVVIAAIHTGFKQPKDKITGRIIKAINNKYVDIIAHPTGRLMGTRDAYEIDIERILKAAKDTDTAIEINAYPERLDLDHAGCRMAKDLGVMLAVSTDAHMKEQLDNMRYGISVARRGWLEKGDILNALPLAKLEKRLKK